LFTEPVEPVAVAGSTPVLLVDDLRIVARLKLLAENHLPPNQERTPHAYYLFLSPWSCRFSLSLSLSLSSLSFLLHRCNQDSFFSIRCLSSLHSLLTIIHAKDKKAMTASVEREETRRCGGEREESERARRENGG
jgi:hypothetical protein